MKGEDQLTLQIVAKNLAAVVDAAIEPYGHQSDVPEWVKAGRAVFAEYEKRCSHLQPTTEELLRRCRWAYPNIVRIGEQDFD